MSTTLNHPTPTDWTTETTQNGWNFPPVHVPRRLPNALNSLDRTILLTIHAVVALGIMATMPIIPATPGARVLIDLGVLAYLAVPAVVMAACKTRHRTWWAVVGPMASALYLWLPSTAAGSVHADAHIVAIVGLATIAPLLNVIAPFILIAQSDARPWPLAGYGFAALGATGLVYASVAYPVVASVGS